MLKNPCYDAKNHKDCENRGAGCSLICALWHAYERQRNEEYEKRKKLAEEDAAVIEHKIRLANRIKKR